MLKVFESSNPNTIEEKFNQWAEKHKPIIHNIHPSQALFVSQGNNTHFPGKHESFTLWVIYSPGEKT